MSSAVSPSTKNNREFLERVCDRAGMPDIFDALDVTEAIFRTMRDLMTTRASERVGFELGGNTATPGAPSAACVDLGELWQGTNPIVAFLSRVRPPLKFDANLFFQRIKLEASLPASVTVEDAVEAVFSATKDELTVERCNEIAGFLPGKVRDLWEQS